MTKRQIELGGDYDLRIDALRKAEHTVFDYYSSCENVSYFESGRSAIRQIASHLQKGDRILLPEFICESVIDCFRNQVIEFYRIGLDFKVSLEDLTPRIDGARMLLLMHYFGKLQDAEDLRIIADRTKECGCIILEDATHSLLSKKRTIGDYVVSSIRKWIPIPNGALLAVYRDPLSLSSGNGSVGPGEDSRAEGMVLKSLFLAGELDCNEEYRAIFADAEHSLEERQGIYAMTDFARFCATCVDLDDVALKRKRNFRVLGEMLETLGVVSAIDFDGESCPLVFPIRVPHRNELRKHLIHNRVYCAVHWPFDGYRNRSA